MQRQWRRRRFQMSFQIDFAETIIDFCIMKSSLAQVYIGLGVKGKQVELVELFGAPSWRCEIGLTKPVGRHNWQANCLCVCTTRIGRLAQQASAMRVWLTFAVCELCYGIGASAITALSAVAPHTHTLKMIVVAVFANVGSYRFYKPFAIAIVHKFSTRALAHTHTHT